MHPPHALSAGQQLITLLEQGRGGLWHTELDRLCSPAAAEAEWLRAPPTLFVRPLGQVAILPDLSVGGARALGCCLP